MVPHGMTYLPYSTYRRVHAPSVATALTIGNSLSREQMYAMAQLVRGRACREANKDNSFAKQCPAWRVPFRMRVLQSLAPADVASRDWFFPGARFMGMSFVAFRSEHFLPDAQA